MLGKAQYCPIQNYSNSKLLIFSSTCKPGLPHLRNMKGKELSPHGLFFLNTSQKSWRPRLVMSLLVLFYIDTNIHITLSFFFLDW